MMTKGYICMTDKFMSGWGKASGGRSIYCLRVETEDEGYTVIANAKRRPEMTRVRYAARLPKIRPGDVLTVRDRSEAPAWYEPGAFSEDERR